MTIFSIYSAVACGHSALCSWHAGWLVSAWPSRVIKTPIVQRQSELFWRNCAFHEESTKLGTMIYYYIAHLLRFGATWNSHQMAAILDFKIDTLRMAIVNRFSFAPARLLSVTSTCTKLGTMIYYYIDYLLKFGATWNSHQVAAILDFKMGPRNVSIIKRFSFILAIYLIVASRFTYFYVGEENWPCWYFDSQ